MTDKYEIFTKANFSITGISDEFEGRTIQFNIYGKVVNIDKENNKITFSMEKAFDNKLQKPNLKVVSNISENESQIKMKKYRVKFDEYIEVKNNMKSMLKGTDVIFDAENEDEAKEKAKEIINKRFDEVEGLKADNFIFTEIM